MRRNRPGHHKIDGPGRIGTVVRQPHHGGVQGTTHKMLRLAQVTPSAAPATGTTAGVCKTAVATPVCDGLRPSQTLPHSCRRVRGRHRRLPDRSSRVAQATAERGIEWLRS